MKHLLAKTRERPVDSTLWMPQKSSESHWLVVPPIESHQERDLAWEPAEWQKFVFPRWQWVHKDGANSVTDSRYCLWHASWWPCLSQSRTQLHCVPIVKLSHGGLRTKPYHEKPFCTCSNASVPIADKTYIIAQIKTVHNSNRCALPVRTSFLEMKKILFGRLFCSRAWSTHAKTAPK